jgi:competence protein ComEC
MATFLSRALRLPERLTLTFIDVLPVHPHWGGVESAAHAGIAQGYGDNTFRPDRAVTRGQMATFLVRAFDL